MIILIQLVGIIFSLIMIYFAILHFQRKELSNNEIFVWVLVWTLVLVAAIFPDAIGRFSVQVLVTRLFDLLVIGGFILVISISVKSYLRSKKIEKKFEEYIRRESLKEAGIIKKRRTKKKKQ